MARPNSYDPQLLPLARTHEHLKDEILLSVYLCDKTHTHTRKVRDWEFIPCFYHTLGDMGGWRTNCCQ